MELGTEWKAPAEPSPTQKYLVSSGGVKIGYTGFVPHGRKHFGSSHRGGVDGTRPGLIEQRKAAQGADNVPEGPEFGTLLLPGMVEDATTAFVGANPDHLPKQPKGGAPFGYSGHRPRSVDPNSPRARVTPFRRHFREVSNKVGVGENQPAHRPNSGSTSTWNRILPQGDDAPPPALRPSTGVVDDCVNDWLVHQKAPPGPLPPDSLSYVHEVGGIKSGYAGFVPHNAAHCGSAHVGLRSARKSGRGSLPQRGHTGKFGREQILRVQQERGKPSGIAAAAVIGYTGHLPAEHSSFGMSAWQNDETWQNEEYTA